MSKESDSELQLYTQKYLHLIQQQKTLLISSVSAANEPECSYAPYVKDSQGVFYIMVSDLAVHSKNMLQNSKASILFVQEEAGAKNIFARERAVFSCVVSEIQKHDKSFDKQLQCLVQRFGEIVLLLDGLVDFHMLALTPIEGKYIAGFGRAFKVNLAEDILEFK